uniref:Protein-serine/threonine phosphatase n=1 Tax=Oncorhynchus tshawytscha TaxID=74940 RepID=A0A8C8IAK7_ONCTS
MAPLDLDKYVEIARQCKYLPENDLKRLCDYVCDLLLEESNVQPVSTPVTVCGDIHGQVLSHFLFDTFPKFYLVNIFFFLNCTVG